MTTPTQAEALSLYSENELASGYGVKVTLITTAAAKLNPEVYDIEETGYLFTRTRKDGTRYFLFAAEGSDREELILIENLHTLTSA